MSKALNGVQIIVLLPHAQTSPFVSDFGTFACPSMSMRMMHGGRLLITVPFRENSMGEHEHARFETDDQTDDCNEYTCDDATPSGLGR